MLRVGRYFGVSDDGATKIQTSLSPSMFGQFRMHLQEARDQTGRAMEDYMHTCTYLPTYLPAYLPTYLPTLPYPTLPYPTQPYRTHRSFYPGSNNGCQARLIPVGMPVPRGCNARPIPRWLYSCNHLFRTTGHPWSKHVKTKFAISAFSSLTMMPWMLTEQAHFAADLDGGPEGCHVALGFGCSFRGVQKRARGNRTVKLYSFTTRHDRHSSSELRQSPACERKQG